MTTHSNRTGIAEELQFIFDWGRIFKQAFEGNPTKTYFNGHYRTCVDTYQTLSGKKPCFNVDLKAGLKRIEDYFLLLEKESGDGNDYKRAQFVVAIAQLIEEGNFIGSQLTMKIR